MFACNKSGSYRNLNHWYWRVILKTTWRRLNASWHKRRFCSKGDNILFVNGMKKRLVSGDPTVRGRTSENNLTTDRQIGLSSFPWIDSVFMHLKTLSCNKTRISSILVWSTGSGGGCHAVQHCLSSRFNWLRAMFCSGNEYKIIITFSFLRSNTYHKITVMYNSWFTSSFK